VRAPCRRPTICRALRRRRLRQSSGRVSADSFIEREKESLDDSFIERRITCEAFFEGVA
jgi:hypothetical protein